MKRALVSMMAATFVAVASAAPAAELPEATRRALADDDLIYTATERKDGSESSRAPVWFWWDEEADVLYTSTSPDSWKARRIARGSPLHVWVGSEDGPHLVGEAERVTDPETVSMLGERYSDKYWIAWIGFFRPRADRVSSGKTIVYRVRVRPADASS